MKYGIIVFDKTFNIGDDIQSYAAMKQLPQIDYYIEREKLNEFVSKNGEKVKTIMSGWFLHNRYCFPPSQYIDPLFISCHFSPLDDGSGITHEYMQGYAAEYMKCYEPIGCRDKVTEELFTANQIKVYRSHCLTLTIPKLANIKKEKKIVLTDVSEKIKEKVTSEYSSIGKVKTATHFLDSNKNSKLSYKERMNNVEKLLKEYQSAELVITTRLHCALPCLALGTPVLLIFDHKNQDVVNRIGDYRDLLDYCSEDEFLSYGLEKYFIKEARIDHLEIKKQLCRKIQSFLKKKPSKEFNYDLIKNNARINKLITDYQVALYNAREENYAIKRQLVNMEYAKEYWENEFNILLKKYEEIKYKPEPNKKDIVRKNFSKKKLKSGRKNERV